MNKYDVQIHFRDYGSIGLSGDEEAINLVKETYSFMSEGYRFLDARKKKYWDGKVHLLKYDRVEMHWVIGIGLLKDIVHLLQSCNYNLFIDSRLTETSGVTREEFDVWSKNVTIDIEGRPVKPYDYQFDSVFSFGDEMRSMLISPTSSGKTVIANLCIKYYYDKLSVDPRNDKILYIVPSVNLVLQGYRDFISYGTFEANELARIYGGSKDNTDTSRIHFATWQTIKNYDISKFSEYAVVINDESHNAKSDVMIKILDNLRYCKYRMGMTGTLTNDRSTTSHDAMKIKENFGKTVQFVTTRELMDRGIITDVNIIMLSLRHDEETIKELVAKRLENKKRKVTKKMLLEMGVEPDDDEPITNDYVIELDTILMNRKRMDVISNISRTTSEKGLNSFIMFRFKEHGKAIYNRLVDDKVSEHIFYIDADVKAEERDRIIQLVETLDGAIIVAVDKIFATGISIRKLNVVFMASPNKTQITVIQAVGRGLRKHEDKDIATVIDLVDNASPVNSKGEYIMTRKNYSLIHGEERAEHYQAHEYDMQFKEIIL